MRSAALAAAAGGVTTIIARPDTLPPIDAPEALEFVTRRAADQPEPQQQPVPVPASAGRHAAPEPDGMHHPAPTSQADRVSRARRHRLED